MGIVAMGLGKGIAQVLGTFGESFALKSLEARGR